jgi:general secretion pathway protein G
VQNAIRRQKEIRLRETLRDIRAAIDEFHRDASGKCGGNPTVQANVDPRTRVMINDCKIFETDNYDRYPPTLETLVEGVEVIPRSQAGGRNMTAGRVFDDPNRATGNNPSGATGNNATEPKTKIYLRELPVDPITGEADWKIRSCYQEKDSADWDNINVFDVRSSAEGEAMNGEKYSDF